jgi:hypothetical protein
VRATASKTEVTVGEPFTVEVEGDGPAGTAWTFPAEAGSEQVELRAVPVDPRTAAPAPGTQRYQATAFALGEVAVPPVSVDYRLGDGTSGTAATEPIPLNIGSLLPRDPKEQTLADIRAPLPLAIGLPFWLALALVVIVLAGLVLWVRARRQKRSRPAEPAQLVLSPDAEALAALDRLQASGALARGEYRTFYIALAETAKRYLERRLSAPVLEMTSSEAVAYLRGHVHGSALAPVVRELASAADQVKFARGPGQAVEAARHLAAVRQLIGTLEAALQPPAAVRDPGRNKVA